MRVLTMLAIAALSSGIGVSRCASQESTRVAVNTVRPVIEDAPRFQFIMFWKENNVQTQTFSKSLDTAISKYAGRAYVTSVNVTDEANRPIVDRYQASRAPMPLALCIAPNGAISGSMTRLVDVTEANVDRLLITPAMTEVTKALQEKQIAVIHITADGSTPLPQGAAQFVADPMFNSRTKVITVVVSDSSEGRFLNDLAINPADIRDSILVVFAPPGVVVGKFQAAATAEQFATALHAAGKCCNDPNCKYNKQGK